jgi:hypothetical protein
MKHGRVQRGAAEVLDPVSMPARNFHFGERKMGGKKDGFIFFPDIFFPKI